MAVFRYRMQNILNLKRKLEDQEKLVFAQARAALDRENERMAQLEGKKEGYEQVLKGELTDSLNVMEIIRLQDGIAALQWHMIEQEKNIRKCEEELERERLRLAEAMKERKMQEKMRANAFELFKREEEQAERKSIDELVAYQHGAGMPSDEGIEGGAGHGEEK